MTLENETTTDKSNKSAYVELLPREIRVALGVMHNDNAQATVACLLEDGDQSFTELKNKLDIHSQSLSDALDGLKDAGIISKRISDTDGEEYSTYYEVTTYGKRFVDCLLHSLGTVDQAPHSARGSRRADNYHDQETGNEPILGWNQRQLHQYD